MSSGGAGGVRGHGARQATANAEPGRLIRCDTRSRRLTAADFDLYYLTAQPPSKAAYDADAYSFLKSDKVNLAPGVPWVFETTLADPQWAILTVSSTTHGGPGRAESALRHLRRRSVGRAAGRAVQPAVQDAGQPDLTRRAFRSLSSRRGPTELGSGDRGARRSRPVLARAGLRPRRGARRPAVVVGHGVHRRGVRGLVGVPARRSGDGGGAAASGRRRRRSS